MAVVVNPLTKEDKLAWLLNDCRATAVASEAHLLPVLAPACRKSAHLKLAVLSGAVAPEAVAEVPVLARHLPFAEASARGGDEPPPRRGLDVDLAALVYTSGSTGEPKGVMLTHRNMLTAAASIASYLGLAEDEVIVGLLPLAFDYGLYQMLLAFRQGARLVLEKSFAYPAQVLGQMAKEHVTCLPGELVLYTGDLCRLDDEGYLTFVGRMDDIIKSRGEKVAPKEVEAALFDVEGVKEAAVVGVPDEVLGQAVKAFVVLEQGSTLTAKELQRECQNRLEGFMVPKLIELRPELPKTATGKIKKTGLA